MLSLHIVLVWVGLRDTQRAEYLADEMAARAAGSEAAAALADSLLSADVMLLLAAREARWRGGPAAWRAAADQARAERVARIPRLRQLSIRDGSRCSPAIRQKACGSG